jgi:glycosyltransferase involved in cell wall biosynthesis
MNKKNVKLIVMDFLDPGGATRINQEIVSNGRDDYILLSGIYSPFESIKKHFNVLDRFEYRINNKNRMTYYLSVFIGTFMQLSKALKKYKIDSIILNSPYSSLAVVLNPLSWKINKTYVFHGAWDLENYATTTLEMPSINHPLYKQVKHPLRKIKYFIHYSVQKISMLFSTNIVAFSNYSKKIVTKYFCINANRVLLSAPPLNQNANLGTLSNDKAVKIKSRYTHGNGEILFLVPSRLEPRKGIHMVLESVKILTTKTNKKFKVLITGAIGINELYALDLLKYCRENELFKYVEFIENVDRENVLFNLMRSSDCVIMPSIGLETLGLITIESMLLGTPVICFNSGASPEILSSFDNRFIVDKINPSALASKMLWFIKLNSKERRNIKLDIKRWVAKTDNPINKNKSYV